MGPDPLLGKSALITGASRGIGAAIARTLAKQGVRVALVARSATVIERMARELGNSAIALPCDLADPEAVAAMTRTAREELNGSPDILVNNAGIFDVFSMEQLSEALFRDTIQTNLVAPFLVIRAFLPGMRERGTGHFVTIGSVADRHVMPGNGAYSPAKFGMRAMHEVLRLELRGSGLRATLVSPASVDTPLWDDVLAREQTRAFPSRDMMLQPQAVADAVLYAVSQPPTVNIDELRLSRS